MFVKPRLDKRLQGVYVFGDPGLCQSSIWPHQNPMIDYKKYSTQGGPQKRKSSGPSATRERDTRNFVGSACMCTRLREGVHMVPHPNPPPHEHGVHACDANPEATRICPNMQNFCKALNAVASRGAPVSIVGKNKPPLKKMCVLKCTRYT